MILIQTTLKTYSHNEQDTKDSFRFVRIHTVNCDLYFGNYFTFNDFNEEIFSYKNKIKILLTLT